LPKRRIKGIISAHYAEISVYLWTLPGWPELAWDEGVLAERLADARYRQGLLLGRMAALGFPLREEATLTTLTEDVVKTSAIEGERLDPAQVRSSIARRLGMDAAGLVAVDRNVEGIVEVMLDATRNFERPLTRRRLFDWHAALFPTGRSGMRRIVSGGWRDDRAGPMQVVAGAVGKEKVHFAAPPAQRVDAEMAAFLAWFNRDSRADPVLISGIAHLWLVTIHPFDDGNGRIARTVADMVLARAERSAQRFYSVSSQIRRERARYYRILERTQKGTLEVTPWLEWFLGCFSRAVDNAQKLLENTLQKARFWETQAAGGFNVRQTKILNRLLEGFEGKLTTGKWAAINKCSQDTAYRDILELLDRGILGKDPAGGRSSSYSLRRAR
jgi:Fic family protein